MATEESAKQTNQASETSNTVHTKDSGYGGFRADEDFFRHLVESLEDYAIITTDKEGCIVSWNIGAKRLFGYDETEVLGKNASALFVDGKRGKASLKAELRDAVHEGNAARDREYKRKDGSIFAGTGKAFPLKDKDGKIQGFTKIIHDLTEAMEATEERRRRTRILESIADAFFALDHDWSFTYINKQAEALLVRSRDELMGNSLWEEFPESIGSVFEKEYKKAVKTKKARSFRAYYPPLKGWFQVSVYPSPDGLSVFFTNVTAQIKAEKELRQSEENFRQLADSMPQLVWTTNQKGTLEYFNQLWYDYTGIETNSDGIEWSAMHPDDRPKAVKSWRYSLKTGEPYEIEARLKQHDSGEYRWFVIRALPVWDDEGKIIKWFGTCTDIEDIKRSAKRKRELEEMTAVLQEQRTQLLALNTAKDEFISVASHQLRTPATGVKQYIGMLREGYMGDLSEDQRYVLDQAHESNERQINIINDLLNIAKLDAGKVRLKRESTDLVALLDNVLEEQFSKFAERNQNITLKKPQGKIVVKIDVGLTRMVLENLVDNASKYTPQDKTITVEIERQPREVLIRIIDKGVGIAKRDQTKLFQKFSRIPNPLSTKVGGSGLGLYWSKKIIDLHDGELTVESRINRGSTFTVTLPRNAKK